MKRQFSKKAALQYIAKHGLKKLCSVMVESDIIAESWIPEKTGDPAAMIFYRHSVYLDRYYTAHREFLYMDY